MKKFLSLISTLKATRSKLNTFNYFTHFECCIIYIYIIFFIINNKQQIKTSLSADLELNNEEVKSIAAENIIKDAVNVDNGGDDSNVLIDHQQVFVDNTVTENNNNNNNNNDSVKYFLENFTPSKFLFTFHTMLLLLTMYKFNFNYSVRICSN
jgi:hypothetical protein